jgi:hypothetical protein
LAIIMIRENCTYSKSSWGVCILCSHTKRDLYINVPGSMY